MRKRRTRWRHFGSMADEWFSEVCTARLSAASFSMVKRGLRSSLAVLRGFRPGVTGEGFAWQFARSLEPTTARALIFQQVPLNCGEIIHDSLDRHGIEAAGDGGDRRTALARIL